MSFWEESEIPCDLTIDYDGRLVNDDGTRVLLVAGSCRPVSGGNHVGGVAYFGGDLYRSYTTDQSPTITQQRCVLLGIENALERAEDMGLEDVVIQTHSESAVKSLTVHPDQWRCGDGIWRTTKRKEVKNQDIMKRCLNLMEGMLAEVTWIRRHDNTIPCQMAKAATYGNTESD